MRLEEISQGTNETIDRRLYQTARYEEFRSLLVATKHNRIVDHFARVYAAGTIQTFQEALCQIIIMACQTENELMTQLRQQILTSMPNSQNAKI